MQGGRSGLEIAKSRFQVHGVDAHGKVVIRKQLTRAKVLNYFAQLPPCLVGLEACGGAHYWVRELQKLGHDARLLAAQYIRPDRPNQKNDPNDAEAICEAVSRPRTRVVPVKSEAQQAGLTVHRARELLVTERTALANQIRGVVLEYGSVIAQGIQRLRRALPELLATETLPELVREVVTELRERLRGLDRRITEYDHRIKQLATQNEAATRLMEVEGVGPLTATASVATSGDGHAFAHGRQFAAWLGLGPKQNSTGGKTVVGRITKHGVAAYAVDSRGAGGAAVQDETHRSEESLGGGRAPAPGDHHCRGSAGRQARADTLGLTGARASLSAGGVEYPSCYLGQCGRHSIGTNSPLAARQEP